MAEHNRTGERGEEIAFNFLKELNYEIIERNWRNQKFEIDIIAKDHEELVFVEVKTRSNSVFGNPEDAVNYKKQQHLIEGADYYLQKNELDLDCRFDVISIVIEESKERINHIIGAFYPQN